MTRTRLRETVGTALLVALAVPLGGCGHSPPTRFFTLAAVRPDGARGTFAGAPLQVRAVHIPAVLDRPERVVGRSAQQLDIIQTQQWAGPLDDMIRRALTQDLSAQLPPGMVVSASVPAPPGTRAVVIDIQEFQPEAGGNVVLDASWVLLGGAQNTQGTQGGARGSRRWQLRAGSAADAQVGAMSALLERLAEAIAASARSAPG
jgi:hypothetical protein